MILETIKQYFDPVTQRYPVRDMIIFALILTVGHQYYLIFKLAELIR